MAVCRLLRCASHRAAFRKAPVLALLWAARVVSLGTASARGLGSLEVTVLVLQGWLSSHRPEGIHVHLAWARPVSGLGLDLAAFGSAAVSITKHSYARPDADFIHRDS